MSMIGPLVLGPAPDQVRNQTLAGTRASRPDLAFARTGGQESQPDRRRQCDPASDRVLGFFGKIGGGNWNEHLRQRLNPPARASRITTANPALMCTNAGG
jgi:hypothetical protein